MSALTTVLSEAEAETAIQLLDDREAAKLEILAAEMRSMIGGRPDLFPIRDTHEAHGITDMLGRAAKVLKEVEALRRARVDPLNAEVRHVNGIFRPFTDNLDSLIAKGKKLLGAWQSQERAREAREREELRKAQEAVAAREAEALAREDHAAAEVASRQQTELAISAGPSVPKGYRSEEGTATVRERWVFEVVDAALVPRSFLTVDEKAIRNAVACGVREIPGVNIYPEDQVVVRSR